MAGCFEDSCGFSMGIVNGAYVPTLTLSNLGTVICDTSATPGATQGLAVNLREQIAVDPINAACNNLLRRDTLGALYAHLPNAQGVRIAGDYVGVRNTSTPPETVGDWSSPSISFTYSNPHNCNAVVFIVGSQYLGYSINNGLSYRDGSIPADGSYLASGIPFIPYNANIISQLLIDGSSVNTSRFDIGGTMYYNGGAQLKKMVEEIVHVKPIAAGGSFTIYDRARHEGVEQRLNVRADGLGSPDQNSGFRTVINMIAIPLQENAYSGNIGPNLSPVPGVTAGAATAGVGDA